MRSVWGSSPTDVYITGHNNNPGQMYHFDGIKWSDVILYSQMGGYIETYVDNEAMIGFSANNIWAGGWSGENLGAQLMHFDGKKWLPISFPESRSWRALTCIGGTGSNDLWIGGNLPRYTLHFDGAVWRKDSLPIISPTLSGGGFFNMKSITSDQIGNIYAIGTTYYNTGNIASINYFFSWKNTKWILIDSAVFKQGYVENKWGYNTLWVSPSNTLYSVGRYVSVWKDGKWTMLIDAWINKLGIGGSSDDNLFVVGDYGTILHFNGIDWYTLPVYNDPNVSYFDVWTDGNEVFIVGVVTTFPMKSIVIHGK